MENNMNYQAKIFEPFPLNNLGEFPITNNQGNK